MIANPWVVQQLTLVLICAIPFVIWGWRNGLDAVIIAVIGVLVGMFLAPVIGGAMVTVVNSLWKFLNAVLSGGFGDDLSARMAEVPALIETPEQIALLGTVLFFLILYVSFRIAYRRAGGKSSCLEGVFGAVGGLVMGYLVVTFVLQRLFSVPQTVQIVETTDMPVFNLDATAMVLIIVVVIVAAVFSSRAKKKS